MKNQIDAKINFNKILPASIILGLIIFAAQTLITYFSTGGYSFILSFYNLQQTLISIGLTFVYYYFYALFLVSVFIYIRESLPVEQTKAGLFFALIIFLLGSAPYSIFALTQNFFASDLIFYNNISATYFIGTVSNVLSLLFIGYLISYYFEKFYNK